MCLLEAEKRWEDDMDATHEKEQNCCTNLCLHNVKDKEKLALFSRAGVLVGLGVIWGGGGGGGWQRGGGGGGLEPGGMGFRF